MCDKSNILLYSIDGSLTDASFHADSVICWLYRKVYHVSLALVDKCWTSCVLSCCLDIVLIVILIAVS